MNTDNINNDCRSITPDMTVLDVVSRYRETEKVFKKFDKRLGICICCEALFEPLENVSKRYNIDIEELIHDLNQILNNKKE